MPNLSGEWEDDLTPLRLVTEIAGDEVDPDPIIDAVCEAYERGVSETFEPECERIPTRSGLLVETRFGASRGLACRA